MPRDPREAPGFSRGVSKGSTGFKGFQGVSRAFLEVQVAFQRVSWSSRGLMGDLGGSQRVLERFLSISGVPSRGLRGGQGSLGRFGESQRRFR